MRAYDCSCGEYIEADNDQKLFDKLKDHTQRDHPDEDYPDSRLREMRDQGAYDVRGDDGGMIA